MDESLFEESNSDSSDSDAESEESDGQEVVHDEKQPNKDQPEEPDEEGDNQEEEEDTKDKQGKDQDEQAAAEPAADGQGGFRFNFGGAEPQPEPQETGKRSKRKKRKKSKGGRRHQGGGGGGGRAGGSGRCQPRVSSAEEATEEEGAGERTGRDASVHGAVVALAVRQLEAALKRTEPRPPTEAEGALAALSLSRLSAWLLTVLTHRCATAAAISERLDQLRDGGRSAAEHMAIIDELFGWEQMCQAVASSQLTGRSGEEVDQLFAHAQ